MTRRGALLFAAMGLIWGTPYFMIRVAVRQLDPGTLVFARTAAASLLLIPLALAREVLPSLKGLWGWLLLYSAVEIAIPWALLATAEQRLSSSLSGLLVATVPSVAIVITRVVRPQEHIGRRRLVGLGIGFAGVLAVVGFATEGSSLGSIGLMAIVVTCYAVGPMLLAWRLHTANALAVVATSVAVVALGYLPWGVTHWPAHWRAETVWSIVGLAGLCTVVAFVIFLALIQTIGPSRSVVITYANTAVAVVIGVVGLHESLSAGLIVGFPLIVAGSVLATTMVGVSATAPPAPTPSQ